MTDTDHPVGERVAAVETDVKHILNGIDRIEARLATGEDRLTEVRDELKADIKETKDEFKADIAGVDNRLTGMRDELKADIAGVDNRLIGMRDELKADIAGVDNRLTGMRDELKADIARVEIRIADTKAEFQRGVDILQSAMGHNKTALYAICGTVIAGIIASLVKSGFF